MSNVTDMFEWKRQRDLQTPIGKLLVEYGSTQQAKIDYKVTERKDAFWFSSPEDPTTWGPNGS